MSEIEQVRARAAARRKRLVSHLASGFEDAERWDLEYWQQQTPQQRLSALVAIHRDVEKARGLECATNWRGKRGDGHDC